MKAPPVQGGQGALEDGRAYLTAEDGRAWGSAVLSGFAQFQVGLFL